jgi:ubiquinone/menaquinone biosynthesis C-methylase UbiE
MRTKGYKGLGMEGRVEKWYAKNTRKDLDEFKALAKRMSTNLPGGSRVLEVAPGPGYFAIELAKLGKCKITGLDISNTFVDIARKNALGEGVQVNFQRGNASSMPFPDASFDLIVCRAAFKNFAEPVAALKEMRRVLRPGGKALIIDLRRDAPKETINEYVDKMNIGAVNEFNRFISESGFGDFDIQQGPIGFEIWLRK